MNSAAAAPRVPAYVRPYLRALWPAEPPAVALLPSRADRPVLAAGTLYLPRGITPPAWEGASDPLAGAPDPRGEARLRLATAAHAGAHRAHGGPRFERATLRPVQLALVGLPPDASAKFPAQLSGGMRKRAALARALALEPDVLFLDEPTSGLDPVSAQHFYRLLRALAESLGLTVFFLTHDRDMLVSIADRVIALARGRVIADGPLPVVRASDDPWLQAYFATHA